MNMNEYAARLRAFAAKNDAWIEAALFVLVVVGASWFAGTRARRQSQILSAEAQRLERIVRSSDLWIRSFQPASTEETAIWQNVDYEIQKLGIGPADRLTLAQVIARQAEESGLGGAHLKFSPADSTGAAPARAAAGINFKAAPYGIVITGIGAVGPVSNLLASLPPAVKATRLGLVREGEAVRTTLLLAVYEPEGSNGQR